MAQEKGYFADFFTSPLTEEVEARKAAIEETSMTARRAADLLTTVAAAPDASPADIDSARTSLERACEDAEAARRPINFPVNVCFSPGGCDIMGHAFDILCEASPHTNKSKDDLDNMYNNVDKDDMFEQIGIHRPIFCLCSSTTTGALRSSGSIAWTGSWKWR